jgi:anti-anti-sigma factor
VSTLQQPASMTVMDHHGIVLIEITDELTALEAPDLLDSVSKVLAAAPRNLQLGLVGVTFMDSGGLQALVRIRAMAHDAGVPMQLLGPTPRVSRLLEVVGLAGVFDTIG